MSDNQSNIVIFYKNVILALKNPLWQNLAVIILTCIFLIIVSIFWILPSIKRAEDSAIKLQNNIAIQTQDLLEQFIQFRIEDLVHMGNHSVEDTTNADKSYTRSVNYFENKTDFLSFMLLDKNGMLITQASRANKETSLPSTSLADTLFFQKAISSKTGYISPVYFSENGPSVRISKSLKKDGQITAVIVGEFNLELLWIIAKTPIVPYGKVYLIDENGRIIGDPDALRSRSGEDLNYRNVVAELTRVEGPVENKQYVNESGTVVMASGYKTPTTNWGIIVEQSRDKALLQRDQTSQIAFVFISASLILIVMLLIGTLRVIRSEKLKEEFLALVSHNFRTPLTAIKGYLELVSQTDSVKTIKENYLDKMFSCFYTLERLVEETLSISSLGTIGFRLLFRPTDIVSLTNEVIRGVEIQTKMKNLTIDLQAEENLPLIKISNDRIHDVLVNLLDNAIKFSNLNNLIEVKIEKIRDNIVIRVKDTGVGIDKNIIPSLFQKFHRGTSYLAYDYQGMGLGLYYCKLIIEHHDGKIWVDSIKGQGSTFSFSLPIR